MWPWTPKVLHTTLSAVSTQHSFSFLWIWPTWRSKFVTNMKSALCGLAKGRERSLATSKLLYLIHFVHVSHPFCLAKLLIRDKRKNKASSVVVSTPASRPTNAVHVFDWAFSCSMWMEEYMTSLPCNNSGIALHYADLRDHSCLMLQLLLSYAWKLKWRLEATGCASDVLVKLSCVQTADTKRVSSWWE